MSKKKKKNKKLWGLEKRTFTKASQHFMDQDYIDADFIKKHPEAAEFYSKFTEEYYGNKKRDIHGDEDKKKWKGIYGEYNARHRDVYSNFKKQSTASESAQSTIVNPESSIVNLIDLKYDKREKNDE